MHLGTVFSQADSGTDAGAIRAWAVAAEEAGFHQVMAYDHVLGAPVERVGVDALCFSHFSVGFDRFADPSASHERHLATVMETLPAIRAAVG